MDKPNFNLWKEPWIEADGSAELLTIEQLLCDAHRLGGLYEASPLVVVGIHRLLVAILQDIYAPQTEDDLIDIWEAKRFSAEKLAAFGEQYGERFDLYAEDVPFLQSADIDLIPAKWGRGKSIGYLLQEQTAGTAVTHYNHQYDRAHCLCSHCAAKGLLLIPAFSSSGGAGIKPSINGVPPIYIIPGGTSYFDSLTASLTTPKFQPKVADQKGDKVWWRRESPTLVARSTEVLSIGYLHSLTFPARRVRLHPKAMQAPCPRCGQQTTWGVPEMAYAMGESRPKEAHFWQDPFAAYRIKKEGEKPIPIRPVAGRAQWREYAALFLPQQTTPDAWKKKNVFLRPSVIDQLEALFGDPFRRQHIAYAPGVPIPFQTIGLRTDMKMKIWEWQQSGFQVPPKLLGDIESAQLINQAISFAINCDGALKRVFRRHYGGEGGGEELNKSSKQRMSQTYWQTMGPLFREYVLRAGGEEGETALTDWFTSARYTALRVFSDQVEMMGSNAEAQRRCVEAKSHCAAELKKLYEKQLAGGI